MGMDGLDEAWDGMGLGFDGGNEFEFEESF